MALQKSSQVLLDVGKTNQSNPTQPIKWIELTLSSRDMVDFKAPSGRPKGKTKRKLVRWRSKSILKRSLTWAKLSFSCWVTVPTPSCLEKHGKNVNIRNTLLAFLSCSGDPATNFEIINSWIFLLTFRNRQEILLKFGINKLEICC